MIEESEFGDELVVAILLGLGGTEDERKKVVRNLIRHGDLILDRHFTKKGRTRIFHLPSVREAMLPEDVKNPRKEKKPIPFGAAIPMARGYALGGHK